MFQSLLALIGRILISALFLWAAFGKITGIEGTMQFMASKQMLLIPLFLAGAIFLQVVGGILLLIGYKTRFAAWLLIIFIIPATLIFYDFWNYEGEQRLIQQIMFMKDAAVLGGLLAFAAFGPGKFSVDR